MQIKHIRSNLMALIICLLVMTVPVFAQELTLQEVQAIFDNPKTIHNEEYNENYPGIDMLKIWQRAGIDPQPPNERYKEYLFNYEIGKDSKCDIHYPKTKLYSRGNIKALRIGASVIRDYQFLLFRQGNGEWIYFDHIDLFMQQYEDPELIFLGDDLFYIKTLSGSGTNLIYYTDVFYAVIDGKLSKVLQCPDEGHIDGWGMVFDRDFASKMSYSDGTLTMDYTIDVSGNAHYYEPKVGEQYDTFELFTVSRKAVFKKDNDELVLSAEDSTFTSDDLDNLFNGGPSEYYNMFIQEFDKLQQGDERQQEWYEVFMESVNERRTESGDKE